MRRAHVRGSLRPMAFNLILLALIPLAGCGNGDIRKVNEIAIAHRVSYTDETSRNLARSTLGLIKDRHTDYRVGPRDILEISVFEWVLKGETHTVDARVAESGLIHLPVLGELRVGDFTVQQIQSTIEKRLKDDGILYAPRVNVSVKEFRSKLVAVVGAVEEPGLYTLRQNVTTLLAVLTLAGGVTDKAGQVLHVVRTNPPPEGAPATSETRVIAVDLFELLRQGNLDLNVVLRDGDVVRVPRAEQFSVLGFVRQPGRFALVEPVNVLEGIALAGGLQEREASPKACVLKRRTGAGEEIIPLNLVAISRGEAPNRFLLPNDVIDVRQTTAKKVGLEVLDLFRGLFGIGYSLN